jgi:putative transposase|tara:strand:- start:948 stop:1802 length:855 start_codon:yes stop_codon:yes gene_type:complete
MAERKRAIQADMMLSIIRKCDLMDVSRSAMYYQPVERELDLEELEIKKEMDKLHIKYPFMGSRSLCDQLRLKGYSINRKRVQRLMGVMNIHSTAPKPNTSKPGKQHKVYPYLLRNLHIDRANQVWATDITYIPMASGSLYLIAILDWYSRKVLSWRLSNSMDTTFCIDALSEAIALYGTPDIFNTDQGSQFTSDEFTAVLISNDIQISMDGKGRWVDNVFIERLWRSLKYEEVYLKAYDTPKEAEEGIGEWMRFYNHERTHQAIERKTPEQVYLNSKSIKELAA